MMNNKIAVRRCNEYDLHEVYDLISEIYKKTDGPDVKGKRVLVKPNIYTRRLTALMLREKEYW